METDSAGNENFAFDDIDINYDFIRQLLFGDTIEAFASEITTNITNEIRDLEVLGANNPLPLMEENGAASTNTDLSDSMEENFQNLAQSTGSSSFDPPSTTTQQIPPIMENQSPVAGNKDLLNASSSILGNEDIISTNIPDPSVANATTMSQPSFGTPVMGRPKPYRPIRGHMESEILRGRESFLAHGNSNQENLLSPYSAFDPLVGSSTNVGQTMGPFFSSIAPTLPEAYPPTTVGLRQQNGGFQSTFPSQPNGNWMNMNAPIAQSLSPFQIDFVSPQWMAPALALPFAHNMASNNVIRSNIQQLPIYAPQYPQTIMRTGAWMNQQQPNWVPISNSYSYRPLPPFGPQQNQFMASNIIHPRSANSMIPGPSMPVGRTQYLYNGMPGHNQIPGMPNTYAPNYNESALFGHSMQPWPQHFTNQNYQNHMVSNVYNPQGFNANLPGPSSMSLRTPYHSHGTHGVLNFQHPNSSLPDPNSVLPSTSVTQPLHHRRRQQIQSMPSLLDLQTYRPMGHNSRGGLNQVKQMNLGGPIRIGPQHSSYIPPVSSSGLPGTQIPSSQGKILNASVTPGAVAESHPENSVPPRQQAQESDGALNATRRNGNSSIPDTSQESLLNADINQTNATVSVGPSRRRSRPESEDTESSSSSGHSKRKKLCTTPEEVPAYDLPADEGTPTAANAPKPRVFKNTGVYDPAFEKAGLSPDPHLRMFVLNWL